MWFIKDEFWDEFQALIREFDGDIEVIRKIKIIKATESFCKQGKGISLYNRRTINNKVMREMENYKNDKNYHEYSI